MPQTLSFNDLALENKGEHFGLRSLEGEVVQIRGFWYPLSPHEGILSPQPNLKSCCLKSSTSLQHRLLVKGQVESLSPQRALTLEGIFKISPSYDPHGELVQFFVLEQAKEIPQTINSFGVVFYLGILMILLLAHLMFRRNQ